MCGRFALYASGEEVAQRFQLPETPLFDPRYNIAPTQSVPAVRAGDGGRFLSFLKWGLVPSWSSDPKIAYKLTNARSETAASKPSFRSAFKQRRCLIPASAFYEWQKVSAKNKQPYCIWPCDGERETGKGGKRLPTAGARRILRETSISPALRTRHGADVSCKRQSITFAPPARAA
jgi:putative SOS response-associated peptidase YedK